MNRWLTDDRFALFSVWNIFRPCAAAVADPINRAPTEHTDKRRIAFSDEGRKEGVEADRGGGPCEAEGATDTVFFIAERRGWA